ncbi:NUDIX domain-containing protein [Chitinophaga silvatica]|uniref:NUDIX domain-containing protein n=1 Tax=Chitinophaga silvatica TaxID=2282649 RepID=A0A3E1Y6J2_9BACT|nr:NUDIX domain-containing protein [Chitinophaga silvatica]RFS20572.1 NUDIX domain-containing protein [Chitinophaga silvatica]
MQENITIYLNERPLLLCADSSPIPAHLSNAKIYENPDYQKMESVLQKLENGKKEAAIFVAPDVKQLLKKVTLHFTPIVAAGGLITNPAGEILMLFRRGKWDLPKGKQDPGEDLETCAIREIKEETGLYSITLEHKLTETFHYYPMKNKKVLKHTYWYKMLFTGTELTIPQIEEDIQDIEWIKPENINKYLKYSYANIREVFRAADI